MDLHNQFSDEFFQGEKDKKHLKILNTNIKGISIKVAEEIKKKMPQEFKETNGNCQMYF